MKRVIKNNLDDSTIFCPILLNKMLEPLKQKKLEFDRNLKKYINEQGTITIAKNVFTLKCKETLRAKLQLKTY